MASWPRPQATPRFQLAAVEKISAPCGENALYTNVLKKLYVSLVRPHLEYAVPICDLVERVQRFAGRVCLKSWDIGYPKILNSFKPPKP